MARKPKHEEHENHERWLVSYADFITLLFAFFVVMYAISSINEGKYKILSDSIVEAFKSAPTSEKIIYVQSPMPQSALESGKPIPQIIPMQVDPSSPVEAEKQQRRENMKSVATDILKVMDPLVKGGQVKVTESNRGIAIEINASLLFDVAKADLNRSSISVLTAVAKVLAGDNHQIQVEGHTDNQPINSPVFPSNWELSAARAGSVIRLFASVGVSGDRMVAIGYADNRPVEDNATPEGRSRNRRVTVMILAESRGNIQDVKLDPDTRPMPIQTPPPLLAGTAVPQPVSATTTASPAPNGAVTSR
jgi:chemotaxis protein MotB